MYWIYRSKSLGHLFVLDVTDDIWRNVFKKEEIEEIEEVTDSNEFYNELPKRLVELLEKLNGKVNNLAQSIFVYVCVNNLKSFHLFIN